MKFLADENVKRRLCRWLQTHGHDVLTAGKGIRNSHLFSIANKQERILLTNDTDFLNTALYPPTENIGQSCLKNTSSHL